MWVRLDENELEIVQDALSYSIANNRAGALKLAQRLAEDPDPDTSAFVCAVKTNDELEVDADAVISRGEDGAFVMSWSWVSNEQAGIEDDDIASCESCGNTDNNGSDVCCDCGGAITSS